MQLYIYIYFAVQKIIFLSSQSVKIEVDMQPFSADYCREKVAVLRKNIICCLIVNFNLYMTIMPQLKDRKRKRKTRKVKKEEKAGAALGNDALASGILG